MSFSLRDNTDEQRVRGTLSSEAEKRSCASAPTDSLWLQASPFRDGIVAPDHGVAVQLTTQEAKP